MSEKQTEVRRKRLKGQALGELRAAMKKLERTVKSLNRKREDIQDAHDVFTGQVHWVNCSIYDRDLTPADVDAKGNIKPECDREVIGKITKDEEKSQREIVREIEGLNEEVADLKWLFAERLSCLPKDIDPTSGEITGTPVDGVDPYKEQPEPEPEPDDEPAPDDGEGTPLSLDEARSAS